jgi:hypothetical protein
MRHQAVQTMVSHLVIKLVAIDPFSIDGATTVNAQVKILGLNRARRVSKNVTKFVHYGRGHRQMASFEEQASSGYEDRDANPQPNLGCHPRLACSHFRRRLAGPEAPMRCPESDRLIVLASDYSLVRMETLLR